MLHSAASRVGALDLGLVPGAGGQNAAQMAAGGVDVLFLLGADEIEVTPGRSSFISAPTATAAPIAPT